MRRLLVLFAAGLLALAATAAATSAAVTQIKQVDRSTPRAEIPFWSDWCGFAVYGQTDAWSNITLVYNQDGLVVREVETYRSHNFTASTDFGTSVTWKAAFQYIYTYRDGAAPGNPVFMTQTGLNAQGPVIQADGGLATYEGTVLSIAPNGVPVTTIDRFNPLDQHGNWTSLEDYLNGVCAALAPS